MSELNRMFAELWEVFIAGGDLDAYHIEKLIEASGLAVWREATAEDVAGSNLEIEVGDPMLCLTEEGLRIVRH
jgi:hypothetical protein